MSDTPTEVESLLAAWRSYLDTIEDWQTLVQGIEPKSTGCGLVYELPNPIDRPNESFAIADMRNVKITEPHYHPNETEIYIVLQGSGKIVVGGKEQPIEKGSIVVTPPDTAHFTIPDKDLVLAVINTPPFKPENYVVIAETDQAFGFDKAQYEGLK